MEEGGWGRGGGGEVLLTGAGHIDHYKKYCLRNPL